MEDEIYTVGAYGSEEKFYIFDENNIEVAGPYDSEERAEIVYDIMNSSV